MDTNSYLLKCKQLASSIIFYSPVIEKATFLHYQRNHPDWLCEETDSPYQSHLRGEDHELDKPITFLSADTGSTDDLGNLLNHPTTVQLLLGDSTHIHGTTSTSFQTYRDDFIDSLGEMGHQRLMGVLHPYAGEFPVKNGTILYYDKSLVEPQEFSLIAEIQEWLARVLHRWTNTGYTLSDPLYAAALTGIIYSHMVSRIVCIRDKYIGTEQAYSFYIDAELCDYGLQNTLDVLSMEQKMGLARELPYLMSRAGTHETYDFMRDLVQLDSNVSITEFSTRPSQDGDLVAMEGIEKGVYGNWSTQQMASLTGQLETDIIRALVHGSVTDNLPTIKLNVRGTSYLYHDLRTCMLTLWVYLASTDRYPVTLRVQLPNEQTAYLTAKQAADYYTMHRPLPPIDSTVGAVSLYSLAQQVDGYDGTSLVAFPATHSVTRETFPEVAQRVFNTQLALRAAIDTTPMNERVYWEGEFARSYTSFSDGVVDKAAFLEENSLPSLTDEYLDKLFDTFTGYSESYVVLTQHKAEAYKELLERVVSVTTHIEVDTQYNTTAPFLQVPVLSATKVDPILPPFGTIRAVVWNDIDGADGFISPLDTYREDEAVLLVDGANNIIASRVSDSEGRVVFDNVPVGSWRLQVPPITMQRPTTITPGTTNRLTAGWITDPFTLAAGKTVTIALGLHSVI